MTVRAEKPSVNLREKLAELDKPTGIAGEAMLRAETPQEQFNLIGAGRRNLIINGAMQVWQRGTSISGETGNTYLADRWLMLDSGGTYNASQEDMALEDSTVPNFIKHYLEFEATTGNNNMGVYQRIEDVQTLPSGKVVISFYAKGTNPNGGDIELFFRQNFGSGGSTQTTEVVDSFVLTSSWQRFTFVHDVPSLSGKTIGASSYVQIGFRQPDGDSSTDAWTLDITGVQLELGKVATPFEHRSYGEELALCQRYYQVLISQTENRYQNIGSFFTSTRGFTNVPLKVNMRDTPTVDTNTLSLSCNSNAAGISATVSGIYASTQAIGVDLAVTGAGAGNAFSADWVSGTLTAKAEL